MARLKNGMITIVGNQTVPGPKLLDVEITNSFPLISLGSSAILFCQGSEGEDISQYDHLTMPSDLRLHLSGKKERIFFDVSQIWEKVDRNISFFTHYFTFVGLPYHRVPPMVQEGKMKSWYQGMIIAPSHDREFNASTRFFLDFFLHTSNIDLDTMVNYPFATDNMRLAADRSGVVIGPYSFDALQRKIKPVRQVYFSFRMGYAELDDSETSYVYTPLKVFSRR